MAARQRQTDWQPRPKSVIRNLLSKRLDFAKTAIRLNVHPDFSKTETKRFRERLILFGCRLPDIWVHRL